MAIQLESGTKKRYGKRGDVVWPRKIALGFVQDWVNKRTSKRISEWTNEWNQTNTGKWERLLNFTRTDTSQTRMFFSLVFHWSNRSCPEALVSLLIFIYTTLVDLCVQHISVPLLFSPYVLLYSILYILYFILLLFSFVCSLLLCAWR